MEHLIRHLSVYTYEPEALGASVRLKLFPVDFEGQVVSEWTVTANGEEITPLLTTGLGDRLGLWRTDQPTGGVEIVATGKISSRDTNGIVRGLPGHPPPGIYRRNTALTKPDEAIIALAKEVKRDDPLTLLHALNAALYERVEYVSGSSDMATSAGEALKAGKGVCQDHAHLFVAAARSAGIAARYVTGYLQLDDSSDTKEPSQAQAQSQSQSGQSQAQGQSSLLETHAWAEAYVDTIGWIGFDPSSNICPTERYVRLCSGHDALAAAPIRGNVFGETTESLEVSVAMGHAQQ